jgi:threonine synthase
MTALIGNVW